MYPSQKKAEECSHTYTLIRGLTALNEQLTLYDKKAQNYLVGTSISIAWNFFSCGFSSSFLLSSSAFSFTALSLNFDNDCCSSANFALLFNFPFTSSKDKSCQQYKQFSHTHYKKDTIMCDITATKVGMYKVTNGRTAHLKCSMN